MFNWKRPQDMPVTEPTEEQIWATIEAYDPQYAAPIQDRLSWHQEMLEDRNIYGNTFARYSRMPTHDSELPLEHNPTDWVINLNLQHTDDVPLERTVDHLRTGPQDVLQPVFDDTATPGIVNLLSYHMLHNKAKDWDPKSVFGTPLAPISGYVKWAQYHLRTHHSVLKKAGIYQAIYASLFDYSRLPFAWIRGIAEYWDKATNTLWMGPNELTITLTDLQDISGLPIFGTPYEECVPPDHELFQRQMADGQRKGSFIYSSGLHNAFAHYKKFFKANKGSRRCRGVVTLDIWSESFLHKNAHSTQYARLSDPFDFGTFISENSFRKRYEPEGGINSRYILASDIDEETSLIAFIATWLCYFVFPTKNRLFRPSTLLMASLISRGERVALAPASLAYLYHGLGQVSAKTDSRQYDVEAPWHYLHGWVHAHISGSFTCTEIPHYFREQHFPTIMQLSRATAAFNMIQIRTFMFSPLRMIDRFQIIYKSKMQKLSILHVDHHFVDSVTERNTPVLLSKSTYQSIVEYFVGIRPAWLCYRRNESVILQGYNPNRVARQFGFTQATPLYGLPQIPNIEDTKALGSFSLAIRLKTASMAWAFLFRLGTGSRFYIPPQCTSTGISHLWLRWIRHTFSAFLDMGFRKYCYKLSNPIRTEHKPAAKASLEKEDSHKRRRESSSTHRDHSSSSQSRHSAKKSRDTLFPAMHNLDYSETSQPDKRSEQSIYEPLPVDSGEMTSKKKRSMSPPIHQISVQEEPILPCEGPELDMNTHNLLSNICDKTIDGIPVSVHPSLSISTSSERPISESFGNEISLKPSKDVDVPSPICQLNEHSISTEPSLEHITEMEGQASSENIFEPLSGIELSGFISQIRVRKVNPSKSRFSKSLNYMTTALRDFLLRVNIEELPELADFCEEANTLLDCALATGLEIKELQQWESTLRNVETSLFLIHASREKKSIEATEIAFKGISEEVAIIQERIHEKLKDKEACQMEKLWANVHAFCISNELEKLQRKQLYLMQKREMVNQVIVDLDKDCAQIETQASELEKISLPLIHKQKIISQGLHDEQEKRGHVTAQAQNAIAYIRELQARHE